MPETKKTWFLPPDFTFLPDGDLALGTIITHPSRPTLVLASLAVSNPAISFPEVVSIIEPNHGHARASGRSFSAELLARAVELASLSGKADLSWHKSRLFSNVDHEVRTFARSLSVESLQAVLALERVRKYIDGGRFGKRNVYIISGLRVARESFTVTNSVERFMGGGVEFSAPVPAGVPLETRGCLSGSREKRRTDTYGTAPGVVFAYRLHVVREKRDGVETELFSHRTAFCTGEDGEEDEVEEMELVEASAKVLKEDLEVDLRFEEQVIGDESYIIFSQRGA